MNLKRRGQTGIISYFFVVFVFIIIWAFWLGGFIAEAGEQAIVLNSLTGVEAFLYGNLNLFIFIGLAIATLAVTYFSFGGSAQ